ncbi:NAD-dependent epimerase/dehydratase family protein [Nocardioides sp. cx-173]|uniref:NAD-dependent epimerase/dehydratase family protein n=1 Tax=Nocardioides sp. cx-173 TaxID=2898796 RepID=UPI001E491375|nr:NAD-dependent epimerase/dehydratase family protein [Nocardioides sp. cx-173]MCD4526940.1 GDP-mannose 4,6-dehydratase [Nocardioides sp. cx-173]UGB41272.1 GDP-mannose 4,6-dehydratase [Nocardioides sp. cx-173]
MSLSPTTTVAITGVNGFVGRHLAHELRAAGRRVIGVGRDAQAVDPDVLDGGYFRADLTAGWPPLPPLSGVVHLAGHSAVGPSFEAPARYVADNTAMLINLGQSMLAGAVVGRVIVVSSGAVYDASHDAPMDEAAPVGYSSPYVVSKVAVEGMARYYRGRGQDMVVARPFNHIGPGQGAGFLVPDLTSGLRHAMMSDGELAVGDLSTARDYTDVRDVVRAYRLMLDAELGHWVYNVCSGQARSGTEILAILQQNTATTSVRSTLDPSRIRPSDPRVVRGVSDRLHEATGWSPVIKLETSLRDYVQDSA